MTVTLIGVAIFVFALLCALFDGRRLVPALVFFGSFSATAVVNTGQYGMAPAVVFLLFLLLWKVKSGDILRPLDVGRDHLIVLLLIVLFSAMSCVSLLVRAADATVPMIQVTQTAYVLFGAALTIVLSIDLSTADALEAAVGALRLSAAFIACWGIVQAVCFYAGIEYPAFLFNNSTSHNASMFDQLAGNGLSRIASVAVEPSFLALSIMIFGAFGSTVVVLEPRLRTKAWMIPVALTLLVVIASTSTTGYAGLAVLAVLLGRKRPSFMIAAGIVAVLAGAVVILALPSFGDALWSFTLGKGSSGSFSDRVATVRQAVQAIGKHPLLGGGWGSDFSFSIISIMLANVGAIGTALFAVAYGGTLLASWAARQVGEGEPVGALHWRHAAYARGAENAMIVGFVQSSVSGFHFMVADFWCLWAISLGATSCLVTGRTRIAAPRRRHVGMSELATARVIARSALGV